MVPDQGAYDVGVVPGHAARFASCLDAGLGQPHADMGGAGDRAEGVLHGQDGGACRDFKPHAGAVLRLRMLKGARRMQQEGWCAAGARGLRQPPRRHEIEGARGGAEIGDEGAGRPAAQRLFHGPQQVWPALRAHEDKAGDVEPVRGEPRPVGGAILAERKFIAHPQDRAVMAGGKAHGERQREAGGGGEIAHPRRCRLVKRAAEQAAEQPVERAALLSEGERPHRRGGHAASSLFKPRKSLAEYADSVRTAAGGHRLGDFRSCFVPL